MAKRPKDTEMRMLLEEYKTLVVRRRFHERRAERIKARLARLRERIHERCSRRPGPSFGGEF